MDGASFLTLATVAKDDFVEVESKNADYKTILEAQKTLINDFAQTMPELDETENKMKEIDAQIADIDEQLSQSQSILVELLSSKQSKGKSDAASGVLQRIITSFSNDVMALGLDAVTAHSTSVPIFKMIDLEEQCSKLIQNLEESNMYPETQDEHSKRIQLTQSHSQKLSEFLRLLKDIYMKANA